MNRRPDPGEFANMHSEHSAAPLPSLMSVLLAIRATDFHLYEDRLALRDRCDMSGVATIIVDDGSPVDVSREIERHCRERGWRYVFLDTRHTGFSLARARNAGIQAAESEWIYIDDADMAYSREFFQKLLSELFVLDETPFNFLTVPAIYLTERVTAEISATCEIDSHIPRLLSCTLLEDPRGNCEANQTVQSFSPASAILAMRRKTALIAGAYDTSFEGWGGEDRDFAFRLLALNQQLAKPRNFPATKGWNLNDTHVYEGWRALYRLAGDYMARKGFYAFHLFHEPNAWRATRDTSINIDFAKEKAAAYAAKKKIPCVSSENGPRDIIVGYNPFIADCKVRETLANPEIIDDGASQPPGQYVAEILRKPVNSVIMWNPHANAWRKGVYDEFCERGITPIVAERGALPHTVYFDAGGLCITSGSYKEQNWARPLSEDEVVSTRSYIDELRFGTESLERQSERMGAAKLAGKLGIPQSTRILLAPLQLLDDTVTSGFAENGRDYGAYLRELERLSLSLPRNWVMVYKNHPLSLVKMAFSAGVCADGCHINDLLEASDAVTVYNSGTGLLAQAFGKPVFYFGNCFYAIDGVNFRFEAVDDLLARLADLPSPDATKILQFYRYLKSDFYSFAEMQATTKPFSRHSLRSELLRIDYGIIRIPGFAPRNFATGEFDFYQTPLFDVYRFEAISARRTGGRSDNPDQPAAAKPLRTRRIAGRNAEPARAHLAKWRKLRRNPHEFFRDAQNPLLRPLQFIFPRRMPRQGRDESRGPEQHA